MGALPKRKISTRRKGKRRADPTKKLKLPQLVKCPSCAKKKVLGHLCANCGK